MKIKTFLLLAMSIGILSVLERPAITQNFEKEIKKHIKNINKNYYYPSKLGLKDLTADLEVRFKGNTKLAKTGKKFNGNLKYKFYWKDDSRYNFKFLSKRDDKQLNKFADKFSNELSETFFIQEKFRLEEVDYVKITKKKLYVGYSRYDMKKEQVYNKEYKPVKEITELQTSHDNHNLGRYKIDTLDEGYFISKVDVNFNFRKDNSTSRGTISRSKDKILLENDKVVFITKKLIVDYKYKENKYLKMIFELSNVEPNSGIKDSVFDEKKN